MARVLFANLAITTLALPLSLNATTCQVAVGTGVNFPDPSDMEYFPLTFTDAATGLLNEIVYVTEVNGDVFTLVRGQENTAAQNWQAGDNAANLITAATIQQIAASNTRGPMSFTPINGGAAVTLNGSTWTFICTVPDTALGFILSDTGPNPSARDIFWTVVPHGAQTPTSSVLGNRLGSANEFLGGIPVGDVYGMSASGASVTGAIGE